MIAVVNKASAYIKDAETLTSGRAGLELDFQFSEDWNGLAKTAVFKAKGADDKYVVLTSNHCVVPAESMENAGVNLICGIYGTDGEDIIIPTIYFSLGEIQKGAEITGQEPGEITQTLYNQVVALLAAANTELGTVKETSIKQVDVDDEHAGGIGTPSVTLVTDWIDNADHSKGKKATFVFANLKGSSGPGIARIAKTSTEGLTDTYTIYFDDNRTTTFDVTNGAAGAITEVTASVDDNVGTPSVDVTLGGTGNQRTIDLAFHNMKGRDGTGTGDMLKANYDADNAVAEAGGIAAYVDNEVPTELSELTDDATHRTVTDEEKEIWNGKSDFSGSYDDLTDKPTIPTELSQLSDDATHRLVTDTEKSTWDGKYTKPSGGIPPSDLATAIQNALTLLSNAMPAEYNTTTSYAVGAVVMHDNAMYQCTQATSGTWNANYWTQVRINNVAVLSYSEV